MHRRNFLSTATVAALAATIFRSGRAAEPGRLRIPLGLDGHSLRAYRWKAYKLIEFAVECHLDAVLLNGLQYFESMELAHLRKIKELADRNNIKLYVGSGGIAKNARQFNAQWGDAESLLFQAIKVASVLDSPVVNVRIGSINDRFLEGGIQPRIDESVRVLKACRSQAIDAGIRFGFENHAGDLRSEELVTLIEEVGKDVCGAMIDPGNGLWAMEDPMKHLETLAPYVVCNSLRDYMVWQSPTGATFQWTALGQGLMDVPRYISTLSAANPDMPMFVESISNSAREIPFLTPEHWKAYPDLRASDIADFLALCRRGHAIEVASPSSGTDKATFEQQHQRDEFLTSIGYLQRECSCGRKA